jgi:hypothetical protein
VWVGPAQAVEQAILVGQHGVPDVQGGRQLRGPCDPARQGDRPEREVDLQAVGVLHDVARLLDAIVGIGIDGVPVRHEHLPEILQPGAVLEERADVLDHEHDVVVREDVYRRVRVGAVAGK